MSRQFLDRCLLLDLETSFDQRILKIGAIYRGQIFVYPAGRSLDDALAALDRFAGAADFVLGHNVLDHDLPILARRAPGLEMLRKPVIDTLYLSPLAFPENPYHRLVKDYKLNRHAVSDPLADARLAACVFAEAWQSLADAASTEPELAAFYAFCFDALAGLRTLFTDLAGRPPMAGDEALEYLASGCRGQVCAPALAECAGRELRRPDHRLTWSFAVAWLRVAGGASVLPRWVAARHRHTPELLEALRGRPCADPGCLYCRTHHDLEAQLARFFDLAAFRALPAAACGGSLQRAVAARGAASGSLLAVLPTGSGKSLCYQLPALIRYRQRGQLTIVISPLQALMQDQIAHLHARTGLDCAAAINGLLTSPERGAALEKVRLGGVAILYVSPEQLRNRTFRQAIEQREIAAWVFDEAHCLSKWGHDFRPDYLYASRFIRDLARRQGRRPPPPVACFTATAKPDVAREIRDHFRAELNTELVVFGGNLRRAELHFGVEAVAGAAKLARVHTLTAEQLAAAPGAAVVVYFATRRGTERAAEFLAAKGVQAAAFHAGLPAPDKRRVQQAFMEGSLAVVCATNAFGLGIDKDNVRLVIHGDLPGSLESYLQEAGRAGRDGNPAKCVLLFAEADVERQFRLAAASRLSRRDIAQILRGLRRLARGQRGGGGEVVVTCGELLASDAVETSFEAKDRDADTKVKTAIAWLERAQLVERNQNQTRVFQGRLRITSLDEAARRIGERAPQLKAAEREVWLAILAALMNCPPDQGVTADELAEIPALAAIVESGVEDADGAAAGGGNDGRGGGGAGERAGEAVLRILDQMAALDLIESGLQLTAYLKPRGQGGSAAAFDDLCRLERALLEVLAARPPAAATGAWQEVSLRWLNQTLRDRGLPSHPERLRRLLTSLAREGSGEPGRASLLALAYRSRDHYGLRLPRGWQDLLDLAERRRATAGCVLAALLALAPAADAAAARAAGGPQTTVRIAFAIADLAAALRSDLDLAARTPEPESAAERALLLLHDLEVIQLQHGLAVFRQAMTIRLRAGKRGVRYTEEDFRTLREHYRERTFQIHVMARYAELGLRDMDRALEFVDDYFSAEREAFSRRHFPGEAAMLARATGRDSYRRIVESLDNAAQSAVVAAHADASLLVLAGPGSGKTRVVVHRCAYLLRVERVPASAILVVCFNRSAAREAAQRLRQLVGDDARGVMVQTYHGLALRLTGTSLAAGALQGGAEPDFARLIDDANRLLRQPAAAEAAAAAQPGGLLRDRILAGFSHVLVDEYQDINEAQYELIGHLAGRREAEQDRRLPILAVGDDDQTIYGWNGASVEFLRRFQKDYPKTAVHFLVENFRSSSAIIACADRLIRHNRGRMKQGHPARADGKRAPEQGGGSAGATGAAHAGRVRLLRVAGAGAQAAAVVEHLLELRRLTPHLDWRRCAVLARTRRELEPIRALCEARELPVIWAADREKLPPLHRVREIAALLRVLEARRGETLRASWLLAQTACGVPAEPAANPWTALLREILHEWQDETADAEVAAGETAEFLFDALAERRREPVRGEGIYLGTVHSAKGLEFSHVVLADGGWTAKKPDLDDEEAERRLYYVGMTRARHTLGLLARRDEDNPHLRLIEEGAAAAGGNARTATGNGANHDLQVIEPAIEEPPAGILERRFALLGLGDLFLDYAGRRPPGDPLHARLDRLRPGDPLTAFTTPEGWIDILDASGSPVAALSQSGRDALGGAGRPDLLRVIAMVERRASDSRPDFQKSLRCERWLVPMVEATYRECRPRHER